MFDTAGYDRVQQALRRAEATVVTHEHFDHCAGISPGVSLVVAHDGAQMEDYRRRGLILDGLL